MISSLSDTHFMGTCNTSFYSLYDICDKQFGSLHSGPSECLTIFSFNQFYRYGILVGCSSLSLLHCLSRNEQRSS